MSRIRYGVQIEFTVDNVLDGGPSRASIRNVIRAVVEHLATDSGRPSPAWHSLRDVRIKYIHEATSSKKGRT